MKNKLARQIWEFAIARDLWLSAAHIPGAQNIEADEASRVLDDRTEWALRGDPFKIMCKIFGEPTIDLFASRLNHKVPWYCSWEPEPGAVFIDSFMYNWGTETLIYAFPPFSVIHMVMRKLIQDKAEAIVVVPFWPTQPWFTLFVNILCEEPIVIDVTSDELFLPFRKPKENQHPLVGQLRILVGCCSGDRWRNKVQPEGHRGHPQL